MTNASIDARQASRATPDLGALPVWNLSDLYPSPTSSEFQRDLDKAAADAKHIAERYKGKLAALGGDGAALAEAIKAYEALSDVMGRLGSYAGLLYAADTAKPEYQDLTVTYRRSHRHLHRPAVLRTGVNHRQRPCGDQAPSPALQAGSTTCKENLPPR
jgi:hypothetical protein